MEESPDTAGNERIPRKTWAWQLLAWAGGLLTLVIAGYIVELIKGTPPARIASVLWSPFGAAIDWTANSLARTGTWLIAPAILTHFDVLVFACVLVALAYALRRTSKQLRRLEIIAVRESLDELATKVAVIKGTTANVPVQVLPAAIEHFTPSDTQLLAATVLIDRYPRRLLIEDLAAGMQTIMGHRTIVPQGVIAREMEDLTRRGVAFINDPTSPLAYYGLTIPGRDFMLDIVHK